MTLISMKSAPPFVAGGTTVTGYAAPSRGAEQVSMWRLELAPGSSSPLHRLDVEEVFLGLSGRAVAVLDGTTTTVAAGDCLIVPARTVFALSTGPEEPFSAVACMPAGGRATVMPDGPTFMPPWAE